MRSSIKYYINCIHYLDSATPVQHCFIFYATSDPIFLYSILNKEIIRHLCTMESFVGYTVHIKSSQEDALVLTEQLVC